MMLFTVNGQPITTDDLIRGFTLAQRQRPQYMGVWMMVIDLLTKLERFHVAQQGSTDEVHPTGR